VIREMVEALKLPIRIVGGPIVRDSFGLALSSRNAYLSTEELTVARSLNRVLYTSADAIRDGEKAEDICAEAAEKLLKSGFRSVDYIKLRWGRILAAVWLGKTRLIDNVSII
jgi:pantoate--beta-alanine ligase